MTRNQFIIYLLKQEYSSLVIERSHIDGVPSNSLKMKINDEWVYLKNANPPKRVLLHKSIEPFLKLLETNGANKCDIIFKK